MKQRIECQVYKTLGCLSQTNKEKLLKGLNNCQLLKKDSDIFLENI